MSKKELPILTKEPEPTHQVTMDSLSQKSHMNEKTLWIDSNRHVEYVFEIP